MEILKEAVAIPSVSAEPERRGECVRMSLWAEKVSHSHFIDFLFSAVRWCLSSHRFAVSIFTKRFILTLLLDLCVG